MISVALMAGGAVAAPSGPASASAVENCHVAQKADDVEKIVEFCPEAARQGDPYAQFAFGLMQERGIGVQRDLAEAVRWYDLSARKGNIYAQNNLGLIYAGPDPEYHNIDQALKLLGHAAAKRLVSAQLNLARMYEEGIGVEPDKQIALYWYERAADQGDEGAQQEVARLTR